MEPIIGQIIHFAGNFVPRGWLLCDGRLLTIENNTALYSVIGNKYGGDGLTTFALPDFRFHKESKIENKGGSDFNYGQHLNQLLVIIAKNGSYPSKIKT